MEKDSGQINLSITPKMKCWLDEHPEINKSELFRNAVIRKKQRMEEQVSPILFLACCMGVIFGVAITGIGLGAEQFINTYIRIIVIALGSVLAFVSFVIYTMEKQKVKFLHDKDLE